MADEHLEWLREYDIDPDSLGADPPASKEAATPPPPPAKDFDPDTRYGGAWDSKESILDHMKQRHGTWREDIDLPHMTLGHELIHRNIARGVGEDIADHDHELYKVSSVADYEDEETCTDCGHDASSHFGDEGYGCDECPGNTCPTIQEHDVKDYRVCKKCQGTGTSPYSPDGRPRACGECKGSGLIEPVGYCESCLGTGMVDMSGQPGGNKTCWDCQGTGHKLASTEPSTATSGDLCGYCKSPEAFTHHQVDATDWGNCEYCNGSGEYAGMETSKCDECKGSGLVSTCKDCGGTAYFERALGFITHAYWEDEQRCLKNKTAAVKTRMIMPARCPNCDSPETRGRYHRGGWREYVCLDCGQEFKNRDAKIASETDYRPCPQCNGDRLNCSYCGGSGLITGQKVPCPGCNGTQKVLKCEECDWAAPSDMPEDFIGFCDHPEDRHEVDCDECKDGTWVVDRDGTRRDRISKVAKVAVEWDSEAMKFLTDFWDEHPDLRKKCKGKYGFDPVDESAQYWVPGLREEPEHKSLWGKAKEGDVLTLADAKHWAKVEVEASKKKEAAIDLPGESPPGFDYHKCDVCGGSGEKVRSLTRWDEGEPSSICFDCGGSGLRPRCKNCWGSIHDIDTSHGTRWIHDYYEKEQECGHRYILGPYVEPKEAASFEWAREEERIISREEMEGGGIVEEYERPYGQCYMCKGSGVDPSQARSDILMGQKPRPCWECKGSGLSAPEKSTRYIHQVGPVKESSDIGMVSLGPFDYDACDECGGDGKDAEGACFACGGSGMANFDANGHQLKKNRLGFWVHQYNEEYYNCFSKEGRTAQEYFDELRDEASRRLKRRSEKIGSSADFDVEMRECSCRGADQECEECRGSGLYHRCTSCGRPVEALQNGLYAHYLPSDLFHQQPLAVCPRLVHMGHVGDDQASHHSNPDKLREEHPYWDTCPECGGDGVAIGSTDVQTGEQKQKPCGTCKGIGEAHDFEYWDSEDQLHDFGNYPNFKQMGIPEKSLKKHLKDTHEQEDYEDSYSYHQAIHGINVDPELAKAIMPKKAAAVQHTQPCWSCNGEVVGGELEDYNICNGCKGEGRQAGSKCESCEGSGIMTRDDFCEECKGKGIIPAEFDEGDDIDSSGMSHHTFRSQLARLDREGPYGDDVIDLDECGKCFNSESNHVDTIGYCKGCNSRIKAKQKRDAITWGTSYSSIRKAGYDKKESNIEYMKHPVRVEEWMKCTDCGGNGCEECRNSGMVARRAVGADGVIVEIDELGSKSVIHPSAVREAAAADWAAIATAMGLAWQAVKVVKGEHDAGTHDKIMQKGGRTPSCPWCWSRDRKLSREATGDSPVYLDKCQVCGGAGMRSDWGKKVRCDSCHGSGIVPRCKECNGMAYQVSGKLRSHFKQDWAHTQPFSVCYAFGKMAHELPGVLIHNHQVGYKSCDSCEGLGQVMDSCGHEPHEGWCPEVADCGCIEGCTGKSQPCENCRGSGLEKEWGPDHIWNDPDKSYDPVSSVVEGINESIEKRGHEDVLDHFHDPEDDKPEYFMPESEWEKWRSEVPEGEAKTCLSCAGSGTEMDGTECKECKGFGSYKTASVAIPCNSCGGDGRDEELSHGTCVICRGTGIQYFGPEPEQSPEFEELKDHMTDYHRREVRRSDPGMNLNTMTGWHKELHDQNVPSSKTHTHEASAEDYNEEGLVRCDNCKGTGEDPDIEVEDGTPCAICGGSGLERFGSIRQAEFTPGDTSYPLAETSTPKFNPQPRGKDPWPDRGDVGLPEWNEMVFDPKLKKWVFPNQSPGPSEINYPGAGLMSEAAWNRKEDYTYYATEDKSHEIAVDPTGTGKCSCGWEAPSHHPASDDTYEVCDGCDGKGCKECKNSGMKPSVQKALTGSEKVEAAGEHIRNAVPKTDSRQSLEDHFAESHGHQVGDKQREPDESKRGRGFAEYFITENILNKVHRKLHTPEKCDVCKGSGACTDDLRLKRKDYGEGSIEYPRMSEEEQVRKLKDHVLCKGTKVCHRCEGSGSTSILAGHEHEEVDKSAAKGQELSKEYVACPFCAGVKDVGDHEHPGEGAWDTQKLWDHLLDKHEASGLKAALWDWGASLNDVHRRGHGISATNNCYCGGTGLMLKDQLGWLTAKKAQANDAGICQSCGGGGEVNYGDLNDPHYSLCEECKGSGISYRLMGEPLCQDCLHPAGEHYYETRDGEYTSTGCSGGRCHCLNAYKFDDLEKWQEKHKKTAQTWNQGSGDFDRVPPNGGNVRKPWDPWEDDANTGDLTLPPPSGEELRKWKTIKTFPGDKPFADHPKNQDSLHREQIVGGKMEGQVCGICDGTGKEIDGQTCGMCRGSGIQIPCPDCGHRQHWGDEWASICDGVNAGITDCKCVGRGFGSFMLGQKQVVGALTYAVCRVCSGNGHFDDYRGVDKKCEYCKGSGVLRVNDPREAPFTEGREYSSGHEVHKVGARERITKDCISCGKRIYPDDHPRSTLDNSESPLVAEEYNMEGPTLPQCFVCANNEYRYYSGLRKALRPRGYEGKRPPLWTVPKQPKMCVNCKGSGLWRFVNNDPDEPKAESKPEICSNCKGSGLAAPSVTLEQVDKHLGITAKKVTNLDKLKSWVAEYHPDVTMEVDSDGQYMGDHTDPEKARYDPTWMASPKGQLWSWGSKEGPGEVIWKKDEGYEEPSNPFNVHVKWNPYVHKRDHATMVALHEVGHVLQAKEDWPTFWEHNALDDLHGDPDYERDAFTKGMEVARQAGIRVTRPMRDAWRMAVGGEHLGAKDERSTAVRCPWCKEKHGPSEECAPVEQEMLPLWEKKAGLWEKKAGWEWINEFQAKSDCLCKGTGISNICGTCGGQGTVFTFPQECPECKGSGKTEFRLCEWCEGTGARKYAAGDSFDLCSACGGSGLEADCQGCGSFKGTPGGDDFPCPGDARGEHDFEYGPCQHCQGAGLQAEGAAKESMDLSWGGYDPVRDVSPSTRSAPAPSAQGSSGDPWPDQGDNGTAPPRPGLIWDPKLKKWVQTGQLTYPSSGPMFPGVTDINKVGRNDRCFVCGEGGDLIRPYLMPENGTMLYEDVMDSDQEFIDQTRQLSVHEGPCHENLDDEVVDHGWDRIDKGFFLRNSRKEAGSSKDIACEQCKGSGLVYGSPEDEDEPWLFKCRECGEEYDDWGHDWDEGDLYCPNCGGHYEIDGTPQNGKFERCRRCKGTGKTSSKLAALVECESCHGEGCVVCDNSGLTNTEVFHGNYWCQDCDRTGTCQDCGGKGGDCPDCNGTGRCAYCDGKGYWYRPSMPGDPEYKTASYGFCDACDGQGEGDFGEGKIEQCPWCGGSGLALDTEQTYRPRTAELKGRYRARPRPEFAEGLNPGGWEVCGFCEGDGCRKCRQSGLQHNEDLESHFANGELIVPHGIWDTRGKRWVDRWGRPDDPDDPYWAAAKDIAQMRIRDLREWERIHEESQKTAEKLNAIQDCFQCDGTGIEQIGDHAGEMCLLCKGSGLVNFLSKQFLDSAEKKFGPEHRRSIERRYAINYADVVGYTYDADTHCTECASKAGLDDPDSKDSEGNEASPMFAGEDWNTPAACGTCSKSFCTSCGDIDGIEKKPAEKCDDCEGRGGEPAHPGGWDHCYGCNGTGKAEWGEDAGKDVPCKHCRGSGLINYKPVEEKKCASCLGTGTVPEHFECGNCSTKTYYDEFSGQMMWLASKLAQEPPQQVGNWEADNGIEDPMKKGDIGKAKKVIPGTQKTVPSAGDWNVSIDNWNKVGSSDAPGPMMCPHCTGRGHNLNRPAEMCGPCKGSGLTYHYYRPTHRHLLEVHGWSDELGQMWSMNTEQLDETHQDAHGELQELEEEDHPVDKSTFTQDELGEAWRPKTGQIAKSGDICNWCSEEITQDDHGTWVDSTGGDVCGVRDAEGSGEEHEPMEIEYRVCQKCKGSGCERCQRSGLMDFWVDPRTAQSQSQPSDLAVHLVNHPTHSFPPELVDDPMAFSYPELEELHLAEHAEGVYDHNPEALRVASKEDR